ncbi:MAG: class I SAM-dependent RNA methyltransferase [Spirochaetaceae bacterium]|nr:class I SAM-dependent RNA methyltransferase [Spirochaetaceae bacterium]
MMREDVIEVDIEKLIPGGDGLARLDGMVVFIPGVLPGETVKARVVERKKGWAKTGSPEILKASPDRQTPFCPLFGRCGGCSWQHIAYSTQLESKAAFSREALLRQGGFSEGDIPEFRVTSSRPEGYRSRIRPIILPGGGAGFHSAGSDQAVPVPSCPVASAGVNRFFTETPPALESGTQLFVFGDEKNFWTEGIDGEARAEVAGKTFRFPPESFFQSNLLPLAELIEFVMEDADHNGRACAMDLYGGVGLFGAFLADRFDRVIGVDRDRKSGDWWKLNVGPNGTFHPLSLENWAGRRISNKPDFIVIDPPRTGLSPSVRRVIARLKVPEIAYVSCNPVTQARDLKDLRDAGYKLVRYGVFDLYPQTPHVETVAILRMTQERLMT